MAPTPTDVDTEHPTWPGLAAVGLAGIGFVLVGGVAGVGAALALGAAWYALPAPYAVALGHLLFVALLPAEPGALQLVPAELGLLGILAVARPAGDGMARSGALRFGALLVGGTLLLGGVAALGLRLGGLPGGVLALAAVALPVGYGLHRYERLRLGLLDAGTTTTTNS
jgi:hypothetical protein